MDAFTPAREQDAYATIRGFKYQIDLTLLRWLALEADEHLELEAGEDIDLVARAVADSGESAYVRTLEQIKARAKRVTLRTPSALEALANAHANRTANPSLHLRFCYTTNAEIGREKLSPFPGGARGIELWEQLRTEALEPAAALAALESIRRFFALSTKPRRVAFSTWQAFLAFAQEPHEGLATFISKFEWSCGQPDPYDVPEVVRQRIRTAAGLTDQRRAAEVYDRLVLHVLSLLTKSEPKRLTAHALAEQFTLPTLSAAESKLLQQVHSRLISLELRVGQVEDAVSALNADLDALTVEVGGKFAEIALVGCVSVTPPPTVAKLAKRGKTVGELQAMASDKAWLALHGGFDTGKTHLATLITTDGVSLWVKCSHDMQAPAAAAVLHDSLRSFALKIAERPSAQSYCEVCQQLAAGSFIVLDNLPQHQANDVLTERLAWLGSGCAQAGVKILSTSHYQLPARLGQLLPPNSVVEKQVPHFTDDDVCEVFTAHGAPPEALASSTVRFVNGLASGHPLLVTLAAQFLSRKEWELSEDDMSSLLQGDHTAGIADEVLVRISKTLDLDQREILYRLALSALAVKDSVAIKLAEVAPAVTKPKERLATLVGAWVQRPEQHALVVSPVARNVVSGNLAPQTLRDCQIVLGDAIASEMMGPWDAQIAIGHYIGAEAFGSAGALLLSLLYEFQRRPYTPGLEAGLSCWASLPLPVGMKLGMRLLIRAMQFWVFPKYGKSDAFVLEELDSLMAAATVTEAHPAFHVAALAGLFLSERDFPRAMNYYTHAMPLIRGSDVSPRDLILPRGKKPVEILWNSITNVSSPDHLDLWKSAFDELTRDEQQVVIDSKDARLGCAVLSNVLMLVEARKPEAERSWTAATRAIEELQTWAEKRGWKHLHACALQAEINLRGEYLGDAESSENKVTQFLNRADYGEDSKSLVAGMYGKMLASVKKHDKAWPWLDRAVAHPPAYLGHNWIMTLMAAVRCTANLSRRRELAEQAAKVARGSKSISHIEAAKVLGELAIATLAGEQSAAASLRTYPVWSELAESVLTHRQDDDEWKQLFLMFGHVQNYLLPLAMGGAPPEHASDGSPYMAPAQGMFYTSHPDRAELFHPESVVGVMWYHSKYALAASDRDSAGDWLQRAKDEIENLPESYLTTIILQDFTPDLLNDDDFVLACDRGRRGVEMTVALRDAYARKETDKGAIPPDTPVDEIISALSPEGRQQVEQFIVMQVYFPAMLRLARLALTDRPAALAAAKQMALICKEQATGAADPDKFLGAARVFECVGEEQTAQQLLKLANSFDDKAHQPLRILGYLAVALADSPEESFGSQLATMQVIYAWHPPDGAIHQRLLLPFISDYWSDAFQRQRFSFRSPAIVKLALEDAASAPVNARALGILRAVQPGFAVKGLAESERWLSAEYENLASPGTSEAARMITEYRD